VNLAPAGRTLPMRLPVILLVAAFALAGCNVNQTLNPSAGATSSAVSYDDANPIHYAQTSGSYGGGHGGAKACSRRDLNDLATVSG